MPRSAGDACSLGEPCSAPLATINLKLSANHGRPCRLAKKTGSRRANISRSTSIARGPSRDGYRLKLQLFQDRQLLLETDATLSKSSPLVIKGPQIGAGQLLLLLVVQ